MSTARGNAAPSSESALSSSPSSAVSGSAPSTSAVSSSFQLEDPCRTQLTIEHVDFAYCPIDGAMFDEKDTCCVHCSFPRRQVVAYEQPVTPTGVAKPAAADTRMTLGIPVWRRVLYKRQPYPDDYFEENQFMRGIVLRRYGRGHSYMDVFCATTAITQQICIVGLFVCHYQALKSPRLESGLHRGAVVNAAPLCAIATIPIVYATVESFVLPEALLTSTMRISTVYLAILFLLPVYHNLSSSIAQDSVLQATRICLLLYLLAYDYSTTEASAAKATSRLHRKHHCRATQPSTFSGQQTSPQGAFNLASAMLATVLLASQIPSESRVFLLFAGGVSLLDLLPRLNKIVRYRFPWVSVWMVTPGLVFVLLWSLRTYWPAGDSAYRSIMLNMLLTVQCVIPVWYLRMQKYKLEVWGPWDIPKISSVLAADRVF